MRGPAARMRMRTAPGARTDTRGRSTARKARADRRGGSGAYVAAVAAPDANPGRAGQLARTVGPGGRGLLPARAVELTRGLHGHQDPPVLHDRTAGLGAVRHGQELLDLTATAARRGHAEQPVVVAE